MTMGFATLSNTFKHPNLKRTAPRPQRHTPLEPLRRSRQGLRLALNKPSLQRASWRKSADSESAASHVAGVQVLRFVSAARVGSREYHFSADGDVRWPAPSACGEAHAGRAPPPDPPHEHRAGVAAKPSQL